jgi:hypothetical protein
MVDGDAPPSAGLAPAAVSPRPKVEWRCTKKVKEMRSSLIGLTVGMLLLMALPACEDDPESYVPLKPSDAAVGDAARPDGGSLDGGAGSGGQLVDAAGIDASIDASQVASNDASTQSDAGR